MQFPRMNGIIFSTLFYREKEKKKNSIACTKQFVKNPYTILHDRLIYGSWEAKEGREKEGKSDTVSLTHEVAIVYKNLFRYRLDLA